MPEASPDPPTASILLVDDHAANLLVLETILAPLGQRIVRAASGEEALARLREEDFAVVLLDVMMPGIDGLRTADRARAQAHGAEVPIILMTAGNLPAPEGYAHGAVDVLRKPLDRDVVRAKVAVFVELFRAREQVRRQATRLAVQERWAAARNAALLNASPDAIVGMDHTGRVTEFNGAAEAMFGRQRSEVLGASMADLLIPVQHRDAHRRGLARYLATGESRVLDQRIEVAALRADGTEFPIELAIRRVATEGPPTFLAYARDLTERRAAEQERAALLERERLARAEAEVERSRLHALLMQVPAFISIQRGPEHVYEFANPRYRALVGSRELEGKAVREALPELDGQGIYELLDRVLATGEALSIPELRAQLDRRGDGTVEEGYFNVVYQPLLGTRGQPEGVMTFAYDVTEQVRARQQLEAAEAKFRRIFESNMIGFVFTAADGRVFDANDYFLRMLGFARPDLERGEIHWNVLTPPEYQAVSARAIEQLQTADVSSLFEKEYFRKDGSRVPALLGSARLPARSGEAEFVTFVLDISNRKAMEAERELLLRAAQAGEEQFRTLADTIPLLAWYAEPDGSIPWYNRRWHEYTGMSLTDRKRWDWQSVYDRADLPRIAAKWRAALAAGQPWEDQFRLRRHDGVFRWFLSRAAPLRDSAGQIVRWFGTNVDIDDQKQAETALKHAQHEMAVILAAAGEGIYGLDAEGRTTFINPAAARILGRSVEELHGQLQHDLVHHTRPDGSPYPREDCPIYAAVRTGTVEHRDDEVFWRKDGSSFPVEYTSTPSGDGGRTGSVVVFRDITERRRVERARAFLAQASEAFASSLDYEATLQTVVRLAVPHVADWCAVEITGDDPGATVRLAIAHVDAAKVALAEELRRRYPTDPDALYGVPQVLRTGRSELHEDISSAFLERLARDPEHLRILRELGLRSAMIVPIVTRGRTLGAITFVAAESGRRYGASDLSTAEDLARRAATAIENARLYRALQVAEARNRFLAEATETLASSLNYATTLERLARLAVPAMADSAAVYRLDADGAVRLLALAAVDAAREALQRQLDALLPSRVEQQDRVLPRVVSSGRAELVRELPDTLHEVEGQSSRAGELMRELGVRSYLVVPLSVRGGVFGALALTTSTSGRRFEPADLALAEELARRAGLAVENADLYREAQEANRLKDEFLATVSHELRTPLTAILGWSHLLRTGRPAQMARAVETIERNARAQARIVDDVLDVSRIITGKLRLDLEPINLGDIVQAAVDTVRPAAEAKQIELVTVLDPAASDIAGDAARLQQVVWNLLSNAIKFTAIGGRVEVQLEGGASNLCLRVRDTGQGIRADFLPHMFERFRQADSASTRAYGGLGLGLAIVRHLVELHGGHVTAESEGEARGATFTVTFPIRAGATAANVPHPGLLRSAHPRAAPTLPSLDGVRVLIVDDEADARELIAALLEQQGAEVTAAPSARAAYDVIDQTTPDVLVSDIGMPGEDGYELIRQVRAVGVKRGVWFPAIALTAYARAADKQRALSAGYQLHLTKPIESGALVSAVARLAGRAIEG